MKKLGGEGLVDIEQADFLQINPGDFQQFGDDEPWTRARFVLLAAILQLSIR